MARLAWDQIGEREYETGVDHGVLYLPDRTGVYRDGVAWNGLTTVTESPSGAESNKQYADNIIYLNLVSVEEFGGTIEAFTYPEEFGICDGTAMPQGGVVVGQQSRRPFGFAYRTLIGNDVDATDAGYKLHLVYNATAAPSEKAYATVNDQPEALAFSWEFSTIPVAVRDLKPTSLIVIDSTRADRAALRNLEDQLYGTDVISPNLPSPDEVIALFAAGDRGLADRPVPPTFRGFPDNRITIPTVRGVDYRINDEVVAAGDVVITEDTLVVATLQPGFDWPAGVIDTDWLFEFDPS